MPSDPAHVADYMEAIKLAHKERINRSLIPEVQDFQDYVEENPTIRMSFSMAIEESWRIAKNQSKSKSLRGKPYSPPFVSGREFMALLNIIVTSEPPAFTSADDTLIGFPINALVLSMMSAQHGYVFFRDHRVNYHLQKVLGRYMAFLDSSESTKYLNNGTRGWFSPRAQQIINMSEVNHDSTKPNWGWTSWNDFFTRTFVEGVRPVAEPENDKVIISGCEATPYKISHDINMRQYFWLKGQPYSLQDIFTNDKKDLAKEFEGGSIYQAFLSAFNYHRWTAPVSGVVKDIYSVNGTYYSQSEFVGTDPGAPDDSQGYLTAVAARMVFVIAADDPAIGLVAVVQVGMAECSSTVSTVRIGQHLAKGDEIGMFKYGGSTFCNIFQKGVIRDFVVDVNETGTAIKLNKQIALAN